MTCVCVGCLASDERMYSISASGLQETYRLLAGVKNHDTSFNEMPDTLCWECAALVNKFNMFRHKCERAHLLLRDIYTQHQEVTKILCSAIDRKRYNLTSSYIISEVFKHSYPELNCTSQETKMETDDERNGCEDMKSESLEDEIPLIDISKKLKHKTVKRRRKVTHIHRKHKSRKKSKNIDEFLLKSDAKTSVEVEVTIKKEDDTEENADFEINSDLIKEENSNYDNHNIKDNRTALRKRQQIVDSENTKIHVNLRKKKRKRKAEISDHVEKRIPSNEKLDLTEFATLVTLTQEQQMEEIRKRQETTTFKEAFFKCTLCFKGFVNQNAYNNHMRKHDPATGEFICDICKSRFKKRYLVADHIHKVHTTKYLCSFCPFVSQCVYQATTHYKWHAGIVYKCSTCNEQFTTKSTYLSHRRIKHASDHACPHCGESFVSELGLLQHTSRLHKNAPPVDPSAPQCATCRVQFASREAWTRHLVISPRHASESRHGNGCRDCGATFGTHKELRAHRTALHRRRKLRPETTQRAESDAISCVKCGEAMSSARAYWQHFRRAHPTERYPSHKPAICEFCGKGFKCKSVLAHHRNTHTGKRSYACPQCPKTFYTPQNLDNHLKSHSDTRPYPCDMCSKAFKFSVALLRHRRIHTGEKPYVCEVCGKAFTDSSGRKVHVRTVHLKEPTPYVSKSRLERRRQSEPAKQIQIP